MRLLTILIAPLFLAKFNVYFAFNNNNNITLSGLANYLIIECSVVTKEGLLHIEFVLVRSHSLRLARSAEDQMMQVGGRKNAGGVVLVKMA